eukprot:2350772-Rhodomonas_salina.1
MPVALPSRRSAALPAYHHYTSALEDHDMANSEKENSKAQIQKVKADVDQVRTPLICRRARYAMTIPLLTQRVVRSACTLPVRCPVLTQLMVLLCRAGLVLLRDAMAQVVRPAMRSAGAHARMACDDA